MTAIPCIYCGHRYLHPCDTDAKRDQCGNWEYVLETLNPPNYDAPKPTPTAIMSDDEALRLAAELDKMMKGAT